MGAPRKRSLQSPLDGAPSGSRQRPAASRQAGCLWVVKLEQIIQDMVAKGSHPAQWAINGFSEQSSALHTHVHQCITNHLDMHSQSAGHPHENEVCFPTSSTRDPIRVPIWCMLLTTPVTGLPPLVDWQIHCKSILHNNFDSRREPLDVRPVSLECLGHAITDGTVVPVKGFTRSSILLFLLAHIFEVLPELTSLLEPADMTMLTRPAARH